MTEWISAALAITGYLIAVFLVDRGKTSLLLAFGVFAGCAHAVLLYQTMHTAAGLNFGVFNAFSLVVWMIAVLLLVGLRVKSLETLVLVIFPLAAFSILLARLFPSSEILSAALPMGVRLHVATSILAIGFIITSAAQSGLLAFQERQLRRKKPGWVIERLPPMQVMESLLFQIILIGFALLTVSIASGAIFQDNFFSREFAHKKFFSVFAGIVFAVLLWGRWQYGWRGRRVVRWHLLGCILLFLGYFGSKLVFEVVLHR